MLIKYDLAGRNIYWNIYMQKRISWDNFTYESNFIIKEAEINTRILPHFTIQYLTKELNILPPIPPCMIIMYIKEQYFNGYYLFTRISVHYFNQTYKFLAFYTACTHAVKTKTVGTHVMRGHWVQRPPVAHIKRMLQCMGPCMLSQLPVELLKRTQQVYLVGKVL